MIAGFVINRFRGERALLEPGLEWLERETGKPVLGVLPYLHGLHPRRRGCACPNAERRQGARLPRRRAGAPAHQQPHRLRCAAAASAGRAALRRARRSRFRPPTSSILPAARTCAPISSSSAQQGWDDAILRHLRYGGTRDRHLRRHADARHARSTIRTAWKGRPGRARASACSTSRPTLEPEKQLRNVAGNGPGRAVSAATRSTWALSQRRRRHVHVGATAAMLATYVHGIFDAPAACAALLEWAGLTGAQRRGSRRAARGEPRAARRLRRGKAGNRSIA